MGIWRVEILLKHVTSIDHQSGEFDRRWKSTQRSSADLPLLVDLRIDARIRLLPYCRDMSAPLSVWNLFQCELTKSLNIKLDNGETRIPLDPVPLEKTWCSGTLVETMYYWKLSYLCSDICKQYSMWHLAGPETLHLCSHFISRYPGPGRSHWFPHTHTYTQMV